MKKDPKNSTNSKRNPSDCEGRAVLCRHLANHPNVLCCRLVETLCIFVSYAYMCPVPIHSSTCSILEWCSSVASAFVAVVESKCTIVSVSFGACCLEHCPFVPQRRFGAIAPFVGQRRKVSYILRWLSYRWERVMHLPNHPSICPLQLILRYIRITPQGRPSGPWLIALVKPYQAIVWVRLQSKC